MRYENLTDDQKFQIYNDYNSADYKEPIIVHYLDLFRITRRTFFYWVKKLKSVYELETKTITYDKNGQIVSKKEGRSQQTDNVDLKKFEPVSFTTNPFGEGKWIRYDKTVGFTPEELKAELDNRVFKRFTIKKGNGSGIGVAMIGDFHLGAYVGDLLKTPDFNYSVACSYLERIANIINEKKLKEVYLFCNGDFIESFTGLNHMNSWKGLHKGAYGVKAIKLAHEILSQYLFSNIKNLSYVGFISGNHDRTTSKKDEDQFGEVAEMLQYLFEKDFKNVDSEHNAMLISKEIDGINYVVTHGHLGISNREVTKVLFDYGKQGVYNIFAKAHKHTRETIKSLRLKKIKYHNIDYVQLDSLDYKAVTIPPLFTGNFYSESLGFSSNAGFDFFENNGRGKANHFSYSI